jgi:hypothetical protein
MTLEFNQIVEQVYRMGSMLDKLDFDQSDLLRLARERFMAANEPSQVWERIHWVRQSDVSGYRGAAPLDTPEAEPINAIFPEPAAPQRATVIACDGSQVYPDEQAAVHYYLLNIGLFIYHHGLSITPEQYTFPSLKYHRADVHDRYGRIISNRTVDDRRTIEEIRKLAEAAWSYRNPDFPVVALYDNRLMYQPTGDEDDKNGLVSGFLRAMEQIRDSGAALAGYIDNPFRSKRFIQLLFLLSLRDLDELRARQTEMARCGDLEGLRDRDFFHFVLRPGERSAVMVQNSPLNKEYRDEARDLEIAFFYLKVYSALETRVVRVDLPMWVARDRQQVDVVHALILDQCRLQGRNPYPYAITRADELAWINGKDSRMLQELVNVEVRRVKEELIGRTLTAKSRGKELARSTKRYHNMLGEEIIDER